MAKRWIEKNTEIISFQLIEDTTYFRNDIEINIDKFELSICTKLMGVYVASNFRFFQHVDYLREMLW